MTSVKTLSVALFKLLRLRRLASTLRAGLLAWGLLLASMQAMAENSATPLPIQIVSPTERAKLEELLTKKMQSYASRNPYYAQLHAGPLSAKLNLLNSGVTVELGEAFGPDADSPEAEEFQHQLGLIAHSMLEGRIDYRGIEFLYGGKDLYYYHPDQWQAPETEQLRRPKAADNDASVEASFPTVVVSSGHGKYRLYNDAGNKFDWVWQRAEANGVREDMVTHDLGKRLLFWLPYFKSDITVAFTRSLLPDKNETGGDWWRNYSARTHLEATYPDHPEIWHNRPDDHSKSREYREDINSRPLFANHIGAGAIVHLHTNASEDPSDSGARAYFTKGRADSEKLADNLLCGMKEVIHSKEFYKHFKVATKSEFGSHGENSKAQMPSALLEVGFHTNPDDTTLLKDTYFHSVAMQGVAKGYWIYSLGKTCVPLEVVSVPDVEGPQDAKVAFPVLVNIHGFPHTVTDGAFAVKAHVDAISCPSGATCQGGRIHASSKQPDGPYEYRHTCTGSNEVSFVARYRLTLEDSDGVSTEPLEYNVTCQSSGTVDPYRPSTIFTNDYAQDAAS